jgi:urea transporter
VHELARLPARHLQSLLQGYAGILFCSHPLAGCAILAVTFIRPEVGLAGVLSAVTALVLCRTARFAPAEQQAALCNAVLAGAALGFAFKPLWLVSGFALAAGAVATLASRVVGGWLHRLNHLPALSLAFVLVTWLFLAICRDVPALQPAEPVLYWHLAPNWLNAFFVSLGWFLFTPDPRAGLVMFMVLLLTSRYLSVLAVAGYAVGASVLTLLGSTVLPHVTGFNFVLAAVCIGIYTFPDRVSFLWGLLAAAAAALFCIGLGPVLNRLGPGPLALPFLLATWLVLGAFAGRAADRRPYLALDNPSLPERSLLSARLARARLIEPGSYPVGVPFSGEWKVSQGFDGPHTHRGPWRHAFDFLLVDERGRSFRGDGRMLEDYHCFGIPVLAPVSGQVWRCRDDLPDNPPGELDVGAGRNFGNHVLLRTSDGVFVLLAHLRQGSLAAKQGQWLEAGAPLGTCGNSGRSTQPHLHLQVQTGDDLGAPTRPFHLRNVLTHRTDAFGPTFRLSLRPLEDQVVSHAVQDYRLARVLHLSAGRTLGFRDDFDGVQHLRVEVGLLGEFRVAAENGATAAFEETPFVQAFYDRKGKSALLDTWVLALGLTPFAGTAYTWDDAPPVGLAPLTLWQRLLLAVLRPFGANFTTHYQRRWDELEAAWRQTGRHRLELLPGLEILILTETLIDPRHGCRDLSITNGGRRWCYRLAEMGVRGDVGIPAHVVSLEPSSAADRNQKPPLIVNRSSAAVNG